MKSQRLYLNFIEYKSSGLVFSMFITYLSNKLHICTTIVSKKKLRQKKKISAKMLKFLSCWLKKMKIKTGGGFDIVKL